MADKADYLQRMYGEVAEEKKKKKRKTGLVAVVDESIDGLALRRARKERLRRKKETDAAQAAQSAEQPPSTTGHAAALSFEEPQLSPTHPAGASDLSRPLMQSGARAGLLTGDQVAAEAEKVRRHRADELRNSKAADGRDAETVHRNKATGDRLQVPSEIDHHADDSKSAGSIDEPHPAVPPGQSDEEYEERLRRTARWEDPMAEKIDPIGGSRYPTPFNRFGIEAGPRWDGVVRGNGFEARLNASIGKRQAREAQAAQWSVHDL